MKWQQAAGAYQAYISLGFTCQTAHQLKRLRLRQYAGPLDWFISPSVSDVARLLRTRFHRFMELRNLRMLGATQECYIIRDQAYGIESYHDFPLYLPAEHWWQAHPAFKQRISRRAQRLLRTMRQQRCCFVRLQASREEAKLLHHALTPLTGGRHCLLIVNLHKQQLQEIWHEDWGIPQVASIRIPKGADWRGSDRAWSQMMRGFT